MVGSVQNISSCSPILNATPSQGTALGKIWTRIHEQYPNIPAFSTTQQMQAWLTNPMSNLNIIHVEELDLSGLELDELSPALGRFTHLKELDLSDNDLTDLPDSIMNLSRLQVLKLRGNAFQTLPPAISQFGQFNQLIELDVANNGLQEVPAWIGFILKRTH
jgi:Leucine-rich repeat (LRR) protein